MKKLNIQDLKHQGFALSPERSTFYAEAASICFDNQKHDNPVLLKIVGEWEKEIWIKWNSVDAQKRNNWADLTEATEYGATGVAILIVYELTNYQVIKRSPRLTGFDYWLGDKEDIFPFQEKARLEISGVLRGTNTQINQRLKEKIDQTGRSDESNRPAFIAIVEFSQPLGKIVLK